MAIKLFRTFIEGKYEIDPLLLEARKIKKLKIAKPFITMSAPEHGLGRIEGVIRKGGSPLPGYYVYVYNSETNQLLWLVKTNITGQFKLRNIAKGMECFVIAAPSETDKPTTNARIKTQIIAG